MFLTDYSQLMKMVLGPEERPIFATYLKDIYMLKESFNYLEFIHEPHTQNTRVDSQAHNTQKQPLQILGFFQC